MSFFENAKLREVFYGIGKFGNDTKRCFVHAPFDRVNIDGVDYTTTRSCEQASGLPKFYLGTTAVVADQAALAARDVWMTELNPIVIGQHQFGNWADNDTWAGLFHLGII